MSRAVAGENHSESQKKTSAKTWCCRTCAAKIGYHVTSVFVSFSSFGLGGSLRLASVLAPGATFISKPDVFVLLRTSYVCTAFPSMYSCPDSRAVMCGKQAWLDCPEQPVLPGWPPRGARFRLSCSQLDLFSRIYTLQWYIAGEMRVWLSDAPSATPKTGGDSQAFPSYPVGGCARPDLLACLHDRRCVQLGPKHAVPKPAGDAEAELVVQEVVGEMVLLQLPVPHRQILVMQEVVAAVVQGVAEHAASVDRQG